MRKLDPHFDPALVRIAEVWVCTEPEDCHPVYLYSGDMMEAILIEDGVPEEQVRGKVQDIFQQAWQDDNQTPVCCYPPRTPHVEN